MKNAKETIGDRIRKAANTHGLSLRQVAIRAGVNPNSLYTITSRGGKRIDWESIQKIAAVLDVSYEYLKYGDILLSPEHRDAFYTNLSYLLEEGYDSIKDTCTMSDHAKDDWKNRCCRHENGEQLDLTYGKAGTVAEKLGIPLSLMIEPKWYHSFVLNAITNDNQIISAESNLLKVVSDICNYEVSKKHNDTYIARLNYLTDFLKRNASMFSIPVTKQC